MNILLKTGELHVFLDAKKIKEVGSDLKRVCEVVRVQILKFSSKIHFFMMRGLQIQQI